MKTIVIYKSISGFTQRYAAWIAEELGCETTSLEEIDGDRLSGYDIVIFGGGLRAGTILGLKKMKALFRKLSGKKLVVYATGAMPPFAKEEIESVRRRNFAENEAEIPFYYFQSGLNYERMNLSGRLMMKVMKSMMKKKKNKTAQDVEAERQIQQSFDKSNKGQIEPLVTLIRGM